MDTVHLTYKEISERLGTQIDSVRKLVRRRRWQKLKGNDGELRIAVPADYFLSQPVAQEPDRAPPQPDAQEPDQVGALALIRELETKIEGLNFLVDAERRRADAAELDRDRWHAMAVRPWWRRLAG